MPDGGALPSRSSPPSSRVRFNARSPAPLPAAAPSSAAGDIDVDAAPEAWSACARWPLPIPEGAGGALKLARAPLSRPGGRSDARRSSAREPSAAADPSRRRDSAAGGASERCEVSPAAAACAAAAAKRTASASIPRMVGAGLLRACDSSSGMDAPHSPQKRVPVAISKAQTGQLILPLAIPIKLSKVRASKGKRSPVRVVTRASSTCCETLHSLRRDTPAQDGATPMTSAIS